MIMFEPFVIDKPMKIESKKQYFSLITTTKFQF